MSKAKIITEKPLKKKSFFNKTDWFEVRELSWSKDMVCLFDGKHNDGALFFKTELIFK